MRYIIFTKVIIMVAIASCLSAQDLEIKGPIKIGDVPVQTSDSHILAVANNGAVSTVHIKDLRPELPKPLDYSANMNRYGVGFTRGTYYKHEDRIYLNGTIRKSTGNILNDDDIFTLPEGYRPHANVIIFGKQHDAGVRLNILPSGRVYVVSADTDHDWINLDGVSFYRNELKVGSSHQGGIIFYMNDTPVDLNGDGNPDKGLIVNIELNIGSVPWGCNGVDLPGSDGVAIGTGAQNTMDILAACSESNIAARNADNFEVAGYDDWFLPSKDEIIELYNQIKEGAVAESLVLISNSGSPIYYWTSSEIEGNTSAVAFTLPSLSTLQLTNRAVNRPVKVIRAF